VINRVRRLFSTVLGARHPIRFLAAQLLWRTGLVRWLSLTIDRVHYKMSFFPTNLSAAYWADAATRDDDERFLEMFLRPADVVVDVGANIGALALRAGSLVTPAGRVYALEAHPQTYSYLVRNVRLNGFEHVIPIHVVVGHQGGVASVSDKLSDDQNEVLAEGLEVPSETLDTLLFTQLPRVDLLKVDVEGYEMFVFQGASHLLGITACVLFESWETHARKYGYGTAEVFDLLATHGFVVCRYQSDRLMPISPGYISSACENLVATRDPAALLTRLARGPTTPGAGGQWP